MSKLNQEELLKWLGHYKKLVVAKFEWLEGDEQAYIQIKEMIQKPEVTEEWIEEKARELLSFCFEVEINVKIEINKKYEKAKDFIRSFVEEIQRVT